MKRTSHNNTKNHFLYFSNNSLEYKLNYNEFCKKYDVHSVIRIQENDWDMVKNQKDYFEHFNLEYTGNKKGNKYAIIKIIKTGYFDPKTKITVEPILSEVDIILAECVIVRNYLPYEKLNSELFKYSGISEPYIQNLQDIIVRRYSLSLKNLSKEEILKLGVAYSKLKIL